MRDRRVRCIVVVGTGTNVGKTYVTRALARGLRRRGHVVLALKPVETGEPFADARSYDADNSTAVRPHPLFALKPQLSPHVAAREAGVEIRISDVTTWCANAASAICDNASSCIVIETAGGVLTPLGVKLTNFELVSALCPDRVVLVAPDALGALNAVSTTLVAMRTLGRAPDHIVLSAARSPDASTGRNAAELEGLGLVSRAHAFGRDGEDDGLAEAVLAPVGAP